MFKTLGSAFKNRELRKGMLITLLLLLVYRLGCFLPTPGLSADFYSEISANDKTGLLGLLNTVTGSALSNAAIFALGVTPYINASIIVQLLAVAIPALERLSKQGEEGSVGKSQDIFVNVISGNFFTMRTFVIRGNVRPVSACGDLLFTA